MRSLHIRCATLCLAMLATLLVMPAHAAVRVCTEPPSTTAGPDPACAVRSRAAIGRPAAHFANRAALKRAAMVQPEPVLTRPLTEAEARQALDLELSLKVGKHMREADTRTRPSAGAGRAPPWSRCCSTPKAWYRRWSCHAAAASASWTGKRSKWSAACPGYTSRSSCADGRSAQSFPSPFISDRYEDPDPRNARRTGDLFLQLARAGQA
jgi:hypothetical protein